MVECTRCHNDTNEFVLVPIDSKMYIICHDCVREIIRKYVESIKDKGYSDIDASKHI
jgi:NAD-dependent SIR2 family protein deacetylase